MMEYTELAQDTTIAPSDLFCLACVVPNQKPMSSPSAKGNAEYIIDAACSWFQLCCNLQIIILGSILLSVFTEMFPPKTEHKSLSFESTNLNFPISQAGLYGTQQAMGKVGEEGGPCAVFSCRPLSSFVVVPVSRSSLLVLLTIQRNLPLTLHRPSRN